jgi:hypothetical protein
MTRLDGLPRTAPTPRTRDLNQLINLAFPLGPRPLLRMLAPIQSCTVQLVSVSIIVAPEKHKSTYLAPVALKIAFTTERLSPCEEH